MTKEKRTETAGGSNYAGLGCLLLLCLAMIGAIVSSRIRWGVAATLGVLTVAGLAAAAWREIADRRRLRRALKILHGRIILVWSRRHGWNELMVNNVLPVLNLDEVYPHCRQTTLEKRGSDPLAGALYDLVVQLPRRMETPISPFLLSLCPATGKVTSITLLNSRFQQFRTLGQKSEVAQAAIRPVLQAMIDAHGAQ